MFHKKTLHELDIAGKVVLLRADYNVPLNDDGSIASNYRITQSIPTIHALREKGCKIVICSHLGRPKGIDNTYSLKVVAKELNKLLEQEVTFVSSTVGERVTEAVDAMQPGDIVLLENLRFHAEEEQNDEEFARAIVKATKAEVFIQDGFGVVHRAHASTDAIARQIPAVAGLLLEKEVLTILQVMHNPNRPLMAIVGGAKIADKIDILYKFIEISDVLVVAGAMANTFLKAQGVEVGESLVDDSELQTAEEVLHRVREVANERQFTFYLPQDGIVADKIGSNAQTRIVDWDTHMVADVEAYPKKPLKSASQVKKHEKILDAGPFSAAFIVGLMQMCQTVVWNGTLGVTETKPLHGAVGPFAHGTEIIMDGLVGSYGRRPYSLIGGGDTSAYIESRAMTDMFNHVSTGGGASLELMAGRDLPGISVLWDKEG